MATQGQTQMIMAYRPGPTAARHSIHSAQGTESVYRQAVVSRWVAGGISKLGQSHEYVYAPSLAGMLVRVLVRSLSLGERGTLQLFTLILSPSSVCLTARIFGFST